MNEPVTTIYCLCEDFFKAMRRFDDPQVRLTTAEVMTVPLVAATFFGANIDRTCRFLYEYGYMPNMISKGRFNHRLHKIDPELWQGLFSLLAEFFKRRNSEVEEERAYYAVDSFPVVVACDNIRIGRWRLYPVEKHGGAFRGYISSKRSYFYALGVHMVVTGAGEPVEFSIVAGSEADVRVFKDLELDLPEGSIICAEKAYTDYHYEDLLKEAGGLELKAHRKKNSKRPMPAWEEFVSKSIRKYIERVFSGISRLFPKKIHAVTPRGFELKIVWFVLAFAIQCL